MSEHHPYHFELHFAVRPADIDILGHVNNVVYIQWVQDVADRAGAPCVVLAKTRRGDREVEVSMPDVVSYSAHRDRTPVVIDDIVSGDRLREELTKRFELYAGGFVPPTHKKHGVLPV